MWWGVRAFRLPYVTQTTHRRDERFIHLKAQLFCLGLCIMQASLKIAGSTQICVVPQTKLPGSGPHWISLFHVVRSHVDFSFDAIDKLKSHSLVQSDMNTFYNKICSKRSVLSRRAVAVYSGSSRNDEILLSMRIKKVSTLQIQRKRIL
jgi:hypothetical protein